ncbi:MAG: excinuclease ABC subunit UvrA [Candidatus Cloacimonetes bacterium]|nr:excinuclease ABC subunit UvrA [Candidatus Cloacimonadota bacterium]
MKETIVIKGAAEHNLKDIDLVIPRNKLIVFTGVSGSGKSSLAFDTLYAEGQRRYVESLSAYARQFLEQMEKPKVDYIEGLSPAISIEQKAASKNPRSTVGTVTEIYDYLRVLFARIGIQHCYQCGREISSQTVDQMVEKIMTLPDKTKLLILAPVIQNRKGEHKEELDKIRQEGFVRVIINGKMRELSEEINLDKKSKHNIDIVIDRLIIKEGVETRLTDSLETALRVADGYIKIRNADTDETEIMSETNACNVCGISFAELTPQHFSFNSPLGMCPSCHGLGTTLEFDPDLIVHRPELSIMEGAVAPWGKLEDKKHSWNLRILVNLAQSYNFSLQTPWVKLSPEIKDILLYGSKGKRIKTIWESRHGHGEYMVKFEGIIPTMKRRMHETSSEGMRRWYLQFISDKPCEDCQGNKLRKETQSVYIGEETIVALSHKTISGLKSFFEELKLDGNRKLIAEELLKEIGNRLTFLLNVGLHYLTLDRRAPSLSGGESQRIRLASQIGSGLVGVMYILDEPSIGLHQRDNHRLTEMLLRLRDIGNTVFVVEHDRDMMLAADRIYDFGPRAGIYGGQIIAEGNHQEIMMNQKSLTGKYLTGELSIPIPKKRIPPDNRAILIKGARQNNLKNIDIEIPIGIFTCVTGVSGSGKSSLINQLLHPALANRLNRANLREGVCSEITGYDELDNVIAIDQQPIGRTPRSNPATYTKTFDPIRKLFASLPSAKTRGYKEGRFSFNVKGGRCEACEGAGVKQISMHFLPDIYVTCETCKGKRYNNETLNIRYKGYNIADVLDMDIQEAYKLFEAIPIIKQKLQTLIDVGLDYMKLGQPSTTLSGGEAQRIKLSRELSKTSTGKTLYILDEPTTGLHFDDINKLMKVLFRLAAMGNTIVVIEHNLDVIKCADHIIDLGPEGGDEGGYVVATGTPEKVARSKKSYTGQFLKDYLKVSPQKKRSV